ncbi:MAG: HlyD family efflux transporter periplasmic adaptor subunit, partial [Victivallales bacterium]|nr:HlyD family efflux transporter periplasmic adaptor subunit [Victivallales bacterium]
DVDAARMRYEKTQFLYDMGAVSANERDAAEAAYQAALGGSVSYQTVTRSASPEVISRAEVQVRQAEAALASAQQASVATELFAPVDGIMYLTEVKEGSEIHAGEPVFRIGATGEMWIEAYAPKEYADLIHVGQTAYYTLDGHEFLSSVAEVQDLSETEQKDASKGTEGMRPDYTHVGQLRVLISIPSHEGVQIRPAMKTTVKVLLNR